MRLRRICMIVAIWAVAVLLLHLLPGVFDSQLAMLRQRGELPLITERLIRLESSDRLWMFVPSVTLLAVALGADWLVAARFYRPADRWISRWWLIALVLVGLIAIALVWLGFSVPAGRLTA